MYTRVCPTCNQSVVHKTKESGRRSEGKECFSCAQKNPNKARKASEANKGKPYNNSRLGVKESEETRRKKSESLRGRTPGFGGRKHSKTTRLKQSRIRAEMLRERYGTGTQISPYYNKDACRLFEEINATLGWNGLHAENGGEFYIGGFWLDYYEPTENVVIEFDEKRHNIPSIKEKDELRQQFIVDQLKCRFIRIPEGQEDTWKTLLEVECQSNTNS